MIPRRFLQILVIAALLLPITICVAGGTSKLLDALNDAGGAKLLERIALVFGLAWILDLIFLAIILGINSLSDPPDTLEE